MNRILFITLDWFILLAFLGNSLGVVDHTQAIWSPTNSASVIAQEGNVQPGKVPIDENVYVTLEREDTAWVLVILQLQADLSGVSQLKTKAEKGTFVYERLTKIASQTQTHLRHFLDSRGAEYRAYWITNMIMVTVDARLLDELSHQPGVARIESYTPPIVESLGYNLGPDYGTEFGPPLPVMRSNQSGHNLGEYGTEINPTSPTTVEWNIQRVGADDVWALGFTGQGVVVGHLDSGVDWTHPALVNHYRPQIPGAPGRHDYNWFDGVGGSVVPIDYSLHGTVTMGPVVGDDGAGNQIGMAPGAYWIACPGTTSSYVGILDCLQWFLAPTKVDGTDPRTDLAPDIINNSWGSATDFQAAFQALQAAGIFSVNIAGNSGPGCNTIINPNRWPEVTTSGAFGQGDIIWQFSSRGSVQIGHELIIKPDIAAPGVNIRSSIPGGGYWPTCTGTSMTAPHITGAVALIISAVPELRGKIDIINMLLKTNAEPKATSECTPAGGVPNNVWGWGILNVYNATLAALELELGGIEGQVVEAGSLEPLEGVKLTFADTTLDWLYSDESNSLGHYEHTLPVGTYVLTATHYGYLDSTVIHVDISSGVTTTQDIELSPAPIWNISGVVTDSQTGEPLSASIVLEDTPVSAETNPESGEYSLQAAQGEWWMDVTSPGYTQEAIKITLDQDLVVNFSLNPTINYIMRRSVDGVCGTQFDWMDAKTGGTAHPLDDDDSEYVTFPGGRLFSFYGISYNGITLGSNGIATFGGAGNLWSGPIPDPNNPNNGIYAFSTDLNPPVGSGNIYTKYIDNRYFVIEWYQVEHFPEGNPETFEIILDLDTNVVKIQYLTVNDPLDVIVGVENSSGTEATLYAYNDLYLVSNNTAVRFYPVFGTPPPSGGPGELLGTVTDGITTLPIEGALVTAVASTTGDTFTYTTDITGTYYASLCADQYYVEAEALDYAPSEAFAPVYPDEQTILNFALTPLIFPPTAVTLTGSTSGWVSTSCTFSATVEPITTTLPLEYVWEADGQVPVTQTAGLTDTISYVWETPGTYTISATASNLAGTVTATHIITVTTPLYEIYLPLVTRPNDIP